MMRLAAQLALPGVAEERDGEWVFAEESEVTLESFAHTTVMRDEIVDAVMRRGPSFAPSMNGRTSPPLPDAPVFVDCTLGGGGHTEAILQAHPTARVIAFDRDAVAREAALVRLGPLAARVTMVAAPFSRLAAELKAHGLTHVDGLCADLGVSSPQLDDAARGMSFRREGPIDMRMDTSSGETALELIARETDDGLANIIYKFGDERRSRRIARSLKRALGENDLNTTLDLRRAIVRAVGPVRVGGVDPATRTFQALRIAVNGELDELEALLAQAPTVLAGGAACAILSFHSLEDRLVKQAFRASDDWDVRTRKPQAPSAEEADQNPRARSAKMRVACRRVEEPTS
jgi:16S rRNA (cytosine1402-N4)-methyltransferase